MNGREKLTRQKTHYDAKGEIMFTDTMTKLKVLVKHRAERERYRLSKLVSNEKLTSGPVSSPEVLYAKLEKWVDNRQKGLKPWADFVIQSKCHLYICELVRT